MRQAIPNEHPWQPQIMDDAGEETTIDLLEIFYLFWGHLKQIIVWLVIGGTIGLNCFDVNDKSRIYYYQHRNRV